MSGRGVLGAALSGVKRDGEGRILSRSFSYPVSLDEGPTDFSVFAGCSDESSNDGADNWIDNVDVSRFARDVAPKFASQPLSDTLPALSPRSFRLSPPLRESSPPRSSHPKPNYSYSCLIALALKHSRCGQLTVSEIYTFMCEHFPYFRTAPSGWKNSVRHNLSLNKCFTKVEVEVGNSSGRKSCLWMVNPEKKHKMDAEVKKWADKDPNGIARALSAEASSTEFKDRRPAFSRLLPLTSLEKRSPLTPRNDRVECAKLTNESFKIVKSTPVEAPTQWSKETSSRPAPTMVVDEPELIGVASPPRTPPQTSGNSGLNLLQSPSPHYPSSFESVAHALSNNSLLASAIAQSPYKGSAITFADL